MDSNKALFLPFMRIQTGHHHTADALMEAVQLARTDMVCDKVDILSYSYGNIERVVTSAYLNWIRFFPELYDRLYRHASCNNKPLKRRSFFYEMMFIPFFRRLVREHHPQVLVSTHALPSNLASRLKLNNQLQSITVNAYTDFFINDVWGIDGIDYHFVPTAAVKAFLVRRGIPAERVFVTGIPIHPVYRKMEYKANTDSNIRVLVTGGSLGTGSIRKLLSSLKSPSIHYNVLCGKNESLYRELLRNRPNNVTPISYIGSKMEMNALYDEADAVLTKPGGVTVSECLMKRKPIFMYDPLPGQEKVNARELNRLGVGIMVNLHHKPEQELLRFFSSTEKQDAYQRHIEEYHRQLDDRPLTELFTTILTDQH